MEEVDSAPTDLRPLPVEVDVFVAPFAGVVLPCHPSGVTDLLPPFLTISDVLITLELPSKVVLEAAELRVGLRDSDVVDVKAPQSPVGSNAICVSSFCSAGLTRASSGI